MNGPYYLALAVIVLTNLVVYWILFRTINKDRAERERLIQRIIEQSYQVVPNEDVGTPPDGTYLFRGESGRRARVTIENGRASSVEDVEGRLETSDG